MRPHQAGASLLFLASLLVAPAARALHLRDDPIAGDTSFLQYLDGPGWTAATDGDGGTDPHYPKGAGYSADSIPATVPGDLISDLHAAGRIGNPLYELNFKNHSRCTSRTPAASLPHVRAR